LNFKDGIGTTIGDPVTLTATTAVCECRVNKVREGSRRSSPGPSSLYFSEGVEGIFGEGRLKGVLRSLGMGREAGKGCT
jgi:hypothetical protein